MRVPFRWRGDASSVRVRGSIESLPGTELRRDRDEWSTEVELADDLRVVYWLGLDEEEDWTRWVPDPERPAYVYPAGLHFTGDREVVGSMWEGPAARPFRWTLERDVPHGRVTLAELDGRRVWLYEPPVTPAASLLLFDGHEYTTLAPAQNVLDNLLADGLIPPVRAVLPDSPETERRMRELGGDPAFLAWCCDGLLPWAGLDAPPERTVVAGSSMGGLAATWFASARPDLFGRALVQSGGFPGMPVVVPAGLPLRFYLDVGVLESSLLGPTRALRDDLRAKGYEVAYQEYAGGHDFFWWGETLADGLVALLS